MFMGIFRRQNRNADSKGSPQQLIASDSGGVITFNVLDPDAGTVRAFPPIDFLLQAKTEVKNLIDDFPTMNVDSDHDPLTEPVTEGIIAAFRLAGETTSPLLTRQSIGAMSLTPELVRAGSLARLRQASKDLTIEGGNGRFRITYPNVPDLAASFLTIADTWLNTDPLNGSPVIAVGDRRFVHICGSHDKEALEGLREIAGNYFQTSFENQEMRVNALTPHPLTFGQGNTLIRFF